MVGLRSAHDVVAVVGVRRRGDEHVRVASITPLGVVRFVGARGGTNICLTILSTVGEAICISVIHVAEPMVVSII